LEAGVRLAVVEFREITMPRSKKKEADTLRRKNRAILFGVIDAIALLIVYLVYLYFGIDRSLLLSLWGFIRLSMALFLWLYDRDAAVELMDFYP
jgi:hypothetical protein